MMTEKLPAYGVRTCGKRLAEPFDVLGPCLLEPGHKDKCMVQAPGIKGGLLNVSEVENPFEIDPVILKYRRYIRRSARIAMVACGISLCASIYSLLHVFHVL
jgi:hypothetical protein